MTRSPRKTKMSEAIVKRKFHAMRCGQTTATTASGAKRPLAGECETAGTSLGRGWGEADTGRHSSSHMIGAVTRKYASPASSLRKLEVEP